MGSARTSVALIVSVLLLAGCGQAAGPGVSDAPSSATPSDGATATPVQTAAPSATTMPSETSLPTPAATPVPTPVPTPAPTPAATPLPTPTPAAPGAAWHLAAGDPIDRIHQAETVAWTGSQFVLAAIVHNPDTGRGEGIAFWTSPDGLVWTMGAERLAGWVTSFDFDAAGGGVAVGYLGTSAVAWTSGDGLHWARVPDQEAFRPRAGEEGLTLAEVALGPAGYVAIGYTRPLAQRAVILVSTDGLQWTRQALAPDFSGVTFDGIAADGSRYVLAGHARSPFRAKFWVSSDGRAWTEVPVPAGADPADASGTYRVVAGAAGWLLVRSGTRATQAAWWSPDGVGWVQRSTPEGDLMSSYEGPVVATPSGFVADAWSDACPSWLWVSSDGTSWSCLGAFPGTPHANRTVAASSDAIVFVNPEGTTWVVRLGG